MAEKLESTEETPKPEGAPAPPKRGLGHRGADPRDTAAELAAKAHQISLEAGSRMSGAMRDLIHAAAGLSGFVVETARDVVQFMVRRGQMAQDEAEKLIHEAEEAYRLRVAAGYVPGAAPTPSAAEPTVAATEPVESPADAEAGDDAPALVAKAPAKSAAKTAAKAPATKTAAKPPAAKTAAKEAPAAAKSPAKVASKATPAKTPAKAGAVKAPSKTPAKAAAKPAAKTAAKTAAKKR